MGLGGPLIALSPSVKYLRSLLGYLSERSDSGCEHIRYVCTSGFASVRVSLYHSEYECMWLHDILYTSLWYRV